MTCYHYIRYQSLPELATRVKEVHHQFRLLSKQHDRLKSKIGAATELVGVDVDKETHADLVAVSSECTKLLKDLPPNSFQKIFWQQQLDAASKKDARTVRWHPLMIRWCLHLRHR